MSGYTITAKCNFKRHPQGFNAAASDRLRSEIRYVSTARKEAALLRAEGEVDVRIFYGRKEVDA